MKKLIMIASVLLGTAQAHANKNQNFGYFPVLVEQDVVRMFWSPCRYQQLGQIEREEIAMYENQGFVLAAKIAMPQPNNGNRIPECQYTFVRKNALR